MRVGITGASGFIGSHLVRRLSHFPDNYKIIKFKSKLDNSHHLRDFVQSSDVIVHLAGLNKGTDEDIVKINTRQTMSLLDFCICYDKKIIIAGSDYNKDDAYKHSKDAVKAICRAYKHIGLNSRMLNIPKVIGSGCKPFYNSFVSTLLFLAAKNQPFEHLIKDENELLTLLDVRRLSSRIEELILNNISGFEEVDFHDDHIYVDFKTITHIIKNPTLDPSDWYGNLYKTHRPILLELLESYKTYENK